MSVGRKDDLGTSKATASLFISVQGGYPTSASASLAEPCSLRWASKSKSKGKLLVLKRHPSQWSLRTQASSTASFVPWRACPLWCPRKRMSGCPFLAVSVPAKLEQSNIFPTFLSFRKFICNFNFFLIGFIDALQPVLVSRNDPDSRKHTIHEITKRATSGEQWPQVPFLQLLHILGSFGKVQVKEGLLSCRKQLKLFFLGEEIGCGVVANPPWLGFS